MAHRNVNGVTQSPDVASAQPEGDDTAATMIEAKNNPKKKNAPKPIFPQSSNSSPSWTVLMWIAMAIISTPLTSPLVVHSAAPSHRPKYGHVCRARCRAVGWKRRGQGVVRGWRGWEAKRGRDGEVWKF